MSIKSIEEVVESHLCTGCGACAFIEPQRYRMADVLDKGRRPFVMSNPHLSTGIAIKACPGILLEHDDSLKSITGINNELLSSWGPVLGVWEGHAVDPDIRFAGSSGGAATALSLFCIERKGMGGVLHTAADDKTPYLNKTVVSNSKEQLLDRTGSRYSPSSPAEGLACIEKSDEKMVFVGKPCDTAAVRMARSQNSRLNTNMGPVISFFCAGTPALKGLFELLKKNGITHPSVLSKLRFRGNGWPGLWTADYIDGNGKESKSQMTYAESWGFLQKYRQWRCYICPDHTGEFSDISVGDPWYRKVKEGEPGSSLIIARTPLGLEIIQQAKEAGYISLSVEDSTLLPRSQPNILASRGSVWGRLVSLRLFGCAIPGYKNIPIFHAWLKELTLRQKIQSIVGTAKRVFAKQLRRKELNSEWKPEHIDDSKGAQP